MLPALTRKMKYDNKKYGKKKKEQQHVHFFLPAGMTAEKIERKEDLSNIEKEKRKGEKKVNIHGSLDHRFDRIFFL